jgi:signal transduction histidine kinase
VTDNAIPSRSRLRQDVWATRLSSVWEVGVIVVGPDQEVDFASARARALLGVTTDAELEQRWGQLKRSLAKAFRSPADSAAPAVETTVMVEAGGTGQDLRVQIYDIAEEDCIGHLLILQHAERAAAIESALRHATLDRGLSSLYRHQAHDLKGLLNVITMNVEILSRVSQGAGAVPADQAAIAERCATVARRELARLDRSLEVVLDRDAVEQAAPRRFDVRVTCQALAELVAARATRQGITVALHVPDRPAEIIGFSDRLHGAILNLIINAFDAMPNGGTLRLEVAHSHSVQVTVCDTGAGIDPHLTGDLWRLHYTTKPGGTGIGLYVTRAVAEAHGGHASHHPNPEGGACFVLELPAAPRA